MYACLFNASLSLLILVVLIYKHTHINTVWPKPKAIKWIYHFLYKWPKQSSPINSPLSLQVQNHEKSIIIHLKIALNSLLPTLRSPAAILSHTIYIPLMFLKLFPFSHFHYHCLDQVLQNLFLNFYNNLSSVYNKVFIVNLGLINSIFYRGTRVSFFSKIKIWSYYIKILQ